MESIRRLHTIVLAAILAVFVTVGFAVPSALAANYTEGDLNYNIDGGKAYVSGLADTSVTTVEIPATVGSYEVVGIASQAFRNQSSLESVSIPASVNSIGDLAFLNCHSLKSITVDSGNTTLESKDGVLYSKESHVPNTANTRYLICYPAASERGSFSIPSSVTTISPAAFYSCSNLKHVSVPASVTTVGSSVFDRCDTLEVVSYLGAKDQWEAIDINDRESDAFTEWVPGGSGKLHFLACVPERSATCTVAGRGAYFACSMCGKNFKDDTHASEITGNIDEYMSESFPVIPHTPEAIPAIAATCEKEGFTAGTKCSVCNHTLEAPASVGFAPHVPQVVEGVEPTCVNDGYTDGVICANCHLILEFPTELPMLPHTPMKVTTKATTEEDGAVVTTCTVCRQITKITGIPKVATVKLSTNAYAYDGKKKSPSLIVKDANGTVLKKGTDYKVTVPSGRKQIGAYGYKVTFKGKYTGTKIVTLRVNPKGTSLTKLKKLSKGFKATWTKRSTKMPTSRIEGYQIQYSTNASMQRPKTVTVEGYTKTSAKVTKLKASKKYYVQVRTYMKVGGKLFYSKWSKVQSVKTKK